MRTVSAEEAKASYERLKLWAETPSAPTNTSNGTMGEWIYAPTKRHEHIEPFSKYSSVPSSQSEFSAVEYKQDILTESLSPTAMQKYWRTPTEFPLCPIRWDEEPLETYSKMLKKGSAEFVASKGADGNAIGGLAVGEPVDKMYEMIEIVNEILPKDKPRYLMGVGTPVNILEGIERGVDMFDCVMPTRNGRNRMLFTKDGIINMRNKKWEMDFSPIEVDGASSVDTLYSKAYLRHLFHAQELLAMQIASIHNLAFYLWLVGEARKHIIAGDFSTWKPMMVKRVSTRL